MSGSSMSRRRLTCSCSFDFDVENPPSDGNVNTVIQHLSPHQILYQAAINGDWKTAQKVLDAHQHYARDTITRRGETVLHVAAMAKQTSFVRKLVRKLDRTDLELRNDNGSTAFCCAVVSGVVENARVMADKNEEVATIRGYDELTPIHQAALMGHTDMVSYLYTVTPLEELLPKERIELLEATIRINMYDVALNILNSDKRRLAFAKLEGNRSLLHTLARKRIARTAEMQQGICRRFLGSTCALFFTRFWNRIQQRSLAKKKAYQLLEEIWTEYVNAEEDQLLDMIRQTEILHYAAKHGNAGFLAMVLRKKPDLLWELNSEGHTIFHVAVIHRQKQVFDLIYHKQHFRDLVTFQMDKGENNILHLTAKLGWLSRGGEERTNAVNPQQPGGRQYSKEVEKIMPQSFLEVSGAALQLQRELLWFKEVGNIVPRYFVKMRNKEGKTPKQIFSEEHRGLMKEGEKWMRDTANSCMIAATLIATMVFAEAFTVPGGNSSDKGTPVLLKRPSFTVFAISDSVAMFSSIVTIIMFLSILISRYTEDDFRVSLPLKLLVGLTSLFVSIVAMLLAFTLAFFLIYDKAWQPKLIFALAGVPFLLFLCLNFKLWFHTTKSIMLSFFLNFEGVVLDD